MFSVHHDIAVPILIILIDVDVQSIVDLSLLLHIHWHIDYADIMYVWFYLSAEPAQA